MSYLRLLGIHLRFVRGRTVVVIGGALVVLRGSQDSSAKILACLEAETREREVLRSRRIPTATPPRCRMRSVLLYLCTGW